jgi:lactate dehydrogenase-like 2-hydroxyacid dehydrogenase
VRKSTRAARDHLAGSDEFKGYLQDVDVLITICFLAVYVTKEMFRKAPNLKLIVTVEGVQFRAFYHKRLTESRV